MLVIKFYPDSDFWDLRESTRTYRELWKKKGKKVTKSIEKISGLKFRETFINAVVFLAKFPSQSFPLSLRGDIADKMKLPILVHELCHRIMVGNHIRLLKNKVKNEQEAILERHKVVDIILYDIWVEIFGRKYTDEIVQSESAIQKTGVYKKAWNWALKFTEKERAKRFSEIVKRSKKVRG
jgi:hypothetical protein